MRSSSFQDEEVARRFLEEVRAGIPYGADQLRVMLQVIRAFHPAPNRIVDLGCGDGALARTLLEAFPEATVLLADHSEPMMARAKMAMHPYNGRCTFLHADFTEAGTFFGEPESVDVIVSGYAIHHIPHDQKQDLYREIYRALVPGGVFVNVEHVASASPELEALWERLFEEGLKTASAKSPEEVSGGHRERKDRSDNILAQVELQVDWLWEIGFHHVDCYFKWFELAVFGGVKPV